MYGGIDHDSTGILLGRDCLERTTLKKVRKIKMRPNVSSHLRVPADLILVTHADAQKTPNHEVSQRQKQPVYS